MVQFVKVPLVGVPNTGVTITILVEVQLEITPLEGVPKTGVTKVWLVEVQADTSPLATVPNAGVTKVGDKLVYVFIADNTTDLDTAVLSLSVINIWSVPTTGDLAV